MKKWTWSWEDLTHITRRGHSHMKSRNAHFGQKLKDKKGVGNTTNTFNKNTKIRSTN